MKKLILFSTFLFVAGFAYSSNPAFRIPIDVNSNADVAGSWSGVETVKLITSTAPALVTDSDSVTISDGFIHWIVCASTPVTGGIYLELRSTGTANVTSARLIPRVFQHEISADNSGDVLLNFKPPIPFSNGLSVNLGPAAATPDTAAEFAVGVGWKKR